MPHDHESLAATTAIIRTLGRGDPISHLDVSRLGISGANSPEKRELERELVTLINRVRYLEASVATASLHPHPTPSGTPIAVGGNGTKGEAYANRGAEVKKPESSCSLPDQSLEGQLAQYSAAQDSISEFQEQVVKNAQDSIHVVTETSNEVERLHQELKKSQQANESFSKALREIGAIVTAVAKGDLSKKVDVHDTEMDTEITTFKNIINSMTDQLQTFASEVSRVAGEVGTEGRLGGQARLAGVEGTWKELTHNVNVMAFNLTKQVREVTDITRAVGNGDLSRKIREYAQGENLELQQTINTMVDQLRSFAVEVSRVSREVGVEGILGGQAETREVRRHSRDISL